MLSISATRIGAPTKKTLDESLVSSKKCSMPSLAPKSTKRKTPELAVVEPPSVQLPEATEDDFLFAYHAHELTLAAPLCFASLDDATLHLTRAYSSTCSEYQIDAEPTLKMTQRKRRRHEQRRRTAWSTQVDASLLERAAAQRFRPALLLKALLEQRGGGQALVSGVEGPLTQRCYCGRDVTKHTQYALCDRHYQNYTRYRQRLTEWALAHQSESDQV